MYSPVWSRSDVQEVGRVAQGWGMVEREVGRTAQDVEQGVGRAVQEACSEVQEKGGVVYDATSYGVDASS